MAKKITQLVEYTDDLDGSKAEGTVTFTYEGTSYELDLSKKNKTAMEKVLKPYIEAARKTRAPRASRGRQSAASSRRQDLAAIRAWASEQGMQVSERGRIPAAVTEAYDAAH